MFGLLVSSGGSHSEFILITLVVFYVAAKSFAAVCERLGVPGIVGELLAGILLGNLHLVIPELHGWRMTVLSSEFFTVASELGVIFLLFLVGLETSLTDMRRVGTNALCVATIGVITPFTLGYLSGFVLPGLDLSTLEKIFLGATLTATSVGITAKVLSDSRAIRSVEGQTILGAAVIDDILGLMILAVVSGLASGEALSAGVLGVILLKVVVFFVGAFIAGRLILHRLIRIPAKWHGSALMLTTALFVMFFMAWAAAKLGLAPIVGAFMAGLLMDEEYFHGYREAAETKLEHLMGPITALFLPLFFVIMGLQIDLQAVSSMPIVIATAILTFVAVIGKIVSGLGLPRKKGDRLTVGYGMIPRGEVGLVFAAVGLHTKAITPAFYGVTVLVVVLTTVISPVLLRRRLHRRLSA
ncbi:MAG: cation:proton antiporter [Deltaproteobacteria bacterium]|nr:cation:proton antiporter [Deltaproteobacteria bacterium]